VEGFVLETPLGPVSVVVSGDTVVKVVLGARLRVKERGLPLVELMRRYFAGESVDFRQVPVALPGGFTGKVLSVVREIPYGEVRTYGEVAEEVGGVRFSRAVGFAVRRNPVPVIVPCHRVVAKGGIGGFSPGLRWKRFLSVLSGRQMWM
jgi:methylated-DNA-[protein]-cysteine S-methyltransferase